MNSDCRLLTVEVTYNQVDRIGAVPQIGQTFPCDEAPNGALYVLEKTSIVQAGRRVGWRIKGHA